MYSKQSSDKGSEMTAIQAQGDLSPLRAEAEGRSSYTED